ncbi:DNA primase [Maritalea mediterranea]|uniref:DNA primase n=1 Tax=Maritalea mediterranea TaxID=2909667 RepID=A0ABS9EB66_9HYPH|nr:DNA primase [Maritalea mediterranea]MCF4099000.1 DNA primase [Maritalea mediterranea]
MRFSDQFLDEIRERLNISQVVGEYVTWDKRKSQPGRGDFWACCPFHGEKTPSFHADDRKGIYHCFGCGVTGDHFRFLVEKGGLSFPEAVERLAGQAGVQLPARDPQQEARQQKRNSLYDVMELATQYFEQALAANVGARARGYLNERGVSPKIQEQFRLGFAPDSRNGLKEFLAQNQVTARQMIDCGLLVAGDDIAVPFDRFRNRLMFPIEDFRGRVVAFGGRAMSPEARAKYLNSPETELFHKRRTLYNGQMARQAAHDGKPLVVVEGYMDVIACVQAGFHGAVAPLGTALTDEHLGLLWKMTGTPILCFDGDSAGQRAAGRSMDVMLPMLKPGQSAKIVTLPEGVDPDDLIKAEGRKGFEDLLASAVPLSQAIWQRETQNANVETPEARAELEARLRGLANEIADPSVKKHYGQAFNDMLYRFFRPQGKPNYRGRGSGGGGGRNSNYGSIKTNGRKSYSPTSSLMQRLKNTGAGAIHPREAVILLGLINHPELAEQHMEDLANLELTSQAASQMLDMLMNTVAMDPSISADKLRAQIEQRGLLDALNTITAQVQRQGIWQVDQKADKSDAEIGLNHALALHYKSVRLNKELKAAELALGNDPSEESYERLRDIQNQISSVDGTEALIEGFGSLSGRSTRSL